MKELIQSFIAVLSTAKGYSENTCRSYRSDLLEFADIIKHVGLSDTASQRMSQSDTPATRSCYGHCHQGLSRAFASTLQKIDHCPETFGSQIFLPVILSNTGISKSTPRMRFRHRSRNNPFPHICPLMICSGCWLRSRRIRCWAYAIVPCLKRFTRPVSGCRNWVGLMFRISIFMNMSFV